MSGCGVCMGHSPSWDGHDINCPVRVQAWKDKAANAEIDRLRAELANTLGGLYAAGAQRDAYWARAQAAEATIARVRELCENEHATTWDVLHSLDGGE